MVASSGGLVSTEGLTAPSCRWSAHMMDSELEREPAAELGSGQKLVVPTRTRSRGKLRVCQVVTGTGSARSSLECPAAAIGREPRAGGCHRAMCEAAASAADLT